MGLNRKTNIILSLIFLGIIAAFAYFYNAYVTNIVTDSVINYRDLLQNYNNEMVSELIKADSVDSWGEIIGVYEDVIVIIENSSNDVVAKSDERSITALDITVQTPFEYRGKAYAIKSSIYFLQDYVKDVRSVVKFILIEFLLALSALLLLISVIYTIWLRPFSHLYKSIEEYDKTGTFVKKRIRGYAGQIYNRFVGLTENLNTQKQNEARIIASISHDIKTPLTSIMGYTERLKNHSGNDSRQQLYLDTVYDKSVEIQKLIEEFDEYLNYNLSKEIKTQRVTSEQIEQYIVGEYFDELRFNGIDLETVNKAQGITVMIDMQKFVRVFGNIFSNSVKHFDKEKKKIRVVFLSDKDNLTVEIHDNGEGVSQEKLLTIFEPFYTSDKGRKVAGLGLSICREIVLSHKGNIYAKPSELGGLAICFELEKA